MKWNIILIVAVFWAGSALGSVGLAGGSGYVPADGKAAWTPDVESRSPSPSSPAPSPAKPDAYPTDPKGVIAFQLKLLKAGDVEKLRECFTDRLKSRITPENVKKGQEEVANYTLDDLVDSVEMGSYEGRETAKIMMKNGRTLTTLVRVNGKWLADTIWFK